MSSIRCCSDVDNDLYAMLVKHGVACSRHVDPLTAICAAKVGDAVMISADGYPDALTPISIDLFRLAREKQLRIYIECPSVLPGKEIGPVVAAEHERAVVTSDAFPGLDRHRLLAIHGCKYQQIKADNPHLVMARVAGFEHAVYGLPIDNVWPILFELPNQSVLVATTKLSHFITARYAPMDAWQSVWAMVHRWLLPKAQAVTFDWTPRVQASHPKDDILPADASIQAIQRATDWFFNAGMLATTDDNGKAAPCIDGDGCNGVLEGYRSKILVDGTQAVADSRRNDCCSESAMALAVRSRIDGDERCAKAAANVQDYIYGPIGFQRRASADPSSPMFGLMSWSEGAMEVSFGDDNARSILGTIMTAAALGEDRWDENMLRAILGNFRTSGKSACQGHNLWEPLLYKYGWEHYWNADEPRLSPHFESWLFACYLWLYDKTKFEPLLERTRRGIGKMMAAYPNDWRWTNGMQQERARMILPLAWLVRVDDTPEHRQWLHRMTDDLLRLQQPCGAIREELGDPSHGLYGPPKSNEKYATNEAPLIHTNGEAVCDLLYTTNFALAGLVEAAAATGDPKLQDAVAKLENFLLRIQVSSPSLPQLDGAWFRAFDFNRWEHWGANADAGWGVWSVETGWTQGWITTMLALRKTNTSFWDFTAKSKVGGLMDRVRPMFLPDRVLNKEANGNVPKNGKLQHVRIASDDLWTCYVGRDLETTVDLGCLRKVKQVGAGFVRSPARGLKLPRTVEFSMSADGKDFQPAGTITPMQGVEGHMMAETLSVKTPDAMARYVRLRASTDAHQELSVDKGGSLQAPDAGQRKIWLFVDEIVVE